MGALPDGDGPHGRQLLPTLLSDDMDPRLVLVHGVKDDLSGDDSQSDSKTEINNNNPRFSTYVPLVVQLVVGQFEFVEADHLPHPRLP